MAITTEPTLNMCQSCPQRRGENCDMHCIPENRDFMERTAPCRGHAAESDKADYTDLRLILDEVYHQAAKGKGQERHADGNAWLDQPWVKITDAAGIGFLTGQAIKKTGESRRMNTDAACKEMLGAMHYLAMAIHYRRTHANE